ncbi:signal peptidase II [Streptococcus uberis]|uniref:signal peptidase II n=1 Tax=Streptococcus uberis TaxID=1349 RepID=UPI0012B6196B|nr:signal peptidase II [Streptococcus uberis]MTB59626.1 signal peptidase II [Streptococcus uberis]
MRLMKLCLGSLVLIALDQLSKLWIVTHIGLGQVKSFLPGLVSLTYLQNRGAAFIYYIKRAPMSKLKEWALILIISGAIGNFIDRMRLSYVVDMIHLDFMNFAIFNVADSYLSIGVVLLMIILWKEE